MARNITINRDEAELIVDLLEYNFCYGSFEHCGVGADLAMQVRELFGMGEQPNLERAPNAEKFYEHKELLINKEEG